MFIVLCSISNQELLEKHLCNPMYTERKKWYRTPQLYHRQKVKYLLHFVVGYVHSNTNQELFKKHLWYHNSHYEKYGRFLLRREPITCYRQVDTFIVSKDEWDTKEDTGKSMKNALYVLRYVKRHLSDRSDVKQ